MTRGRIAAVIALAVVGVAAAAGLPMLRQVAGGVADVPVAEVQRGNLVRKVEAEGNLEAATATVLSAPMKIQMPVKIAWLAPDGSYVKEGDVVVRFDATDLEKDLEDGRADRETAESRLQQNRLQGDTTLKNLDRDSKMASRDLEYARTFQSKDEEIFSRADIIESEIDEALATSRLEHAEQSRGIHAELNDVALELIEIDKRKADLKIQRARTALDELEVTAPHDGIFVLKGRWGRVPEVGQMVWRGNEVAELPLLDVMEAKVFVLEADAGGLAEGLPAEVFLEAHPDAPYRATVKTVDALPKRRDHNVPVQYFEVVLEFETTDAERMKPGQRVRATIVLDEHEDALIIPREAVFYEAGKKIVYRLAGGEFEPVEITAGATAPGRLVVEAGLEEGDLVALRDPDRPADEPSSDEGEPPSGPGVAGAP